MGKIFDKSLAPSEGVYDGKTLDPREIRINAEFNGRHDLPAIDDLLSEFPIIGQLFPVLITKDDDGAPVLLDGHRRWRAAIELTNQKKGPYDGVFKLKCQYFKGSPTECFIATVKANSSRAESLPIDDGFNISKLHHRFAMSHEDIALKVYGRKLTDGSPDVKWVQEREALSDLAAEAAEAVTGGRVKPSAVLELAKLSKTAQRNLIKSTNGTITAAIIKRSVNPNGSGTAASAAALTKNGSDPLTVAEFRNSGNTERKIRNVADFRKLVEEYLEMDIPERIKGFTCENAVRKILSDLLDELK